MKKALNIRAKRFQQDVNLKASEMQSSITDVQYSYESMQNKYLRQQEILDIMLQKQMKLQQRKNKYASDRLTESNILKSATQYEKETNKLIYNQEQQQYQQSTSQSSSNQQLKNSQIQLTDELDTLISDVKSASEQIISLQDQIETCKISFEQQITSKNVRIYSLIEFMPQVNAQLTQILMQHQKVTQNGQRVIQDFNQLQKLADWYSQFIDSFNQLQKQMVRRQQQQRQVEMRRQQIEKQANFMYYKQCEQRRVFSQRNERYLPNQIKNILYESPPCRLRILPSKPHLMPRVTDAYSLQKSDYQMKKQIQRQKEQQFVRKNKSCSESIYDSSISQSTIARAQELTSNAMNINNNILQREAGLSGTTISSSITSEH